jgi:cyclase
VLRSRLIPLLLLSRGRLVKTVRFESPKYVGDPLNVARIFNDKEVDELIVLDIDATRDGREPDFELLEELASECFMPVCYGGESEALNRRAKYLDLGLKR